MKNIIVFLLLLGGLMSYSQVAISKTNAIPDSSSILDIQSTDSGLLIPRMTISERNTITNPATGLLVYSTDDNVFYYFDGSIWVKASGDDLGNHKAKQNLEMQGHWISHDGDDEGIYINDQGNIGMGTNNLYVNNQNKTTRLHIHMDDTNSNVVVERNQDGRATAGFVFLRSRGTETSKAALQDKDGIASLAAFGYDGNEYKRTGLITFKVDGAVSSGTIPTKIIFNTQSQNDFMERVNIKNNGKVGIGTTMPTGMLHIKGDDADIDLDINSSSNPKKVEVRFKEDGNQKAKMYYKKDTGDFVFEQLSHGLLKFDVNFVPAMVINQNRNVGIGVTAPARTLHIKDVLRINPSSEPSNPADGDIYLDSSTNKLRCYANGVWHDLW